MRDDFAALDLLSAGGPRRKKKLAIGQKRRAVSRPAEQNLTSFLPLLAGKMKKKKKDKKEKKMLKGWPVKLSWPTKAGTDFPKDFDFF